MRHVQNVHGATTNNRDHEYVFLRHKIAKAVQNSF